jgi:hypothetical protein
MLVTICLQCSVWNAWVFSILGAEKTAMHILALGVSVLGGSHFVCCFQFASGHAAACNWFCAILNFLAFFKVQVHVFCV